MIRGLYQDHYSAFAKGIPPVAQAHYPLGTRTFADEHSAFCNAATGPERRSRLEAFGRLIPPAYFSSLLIYKASSLEQGQQREHAAHLLNLIYTKAFPDHPLSENLPARCIADVLVALSLEGTTCTQNQIERAVNEVSVKMPSTGSSAVH